MWQILPPRQKSPFPHQFAERADTFGGAGILTGNESFPLGMKIPPSPTNLPKVLYRVPLGML